MASSAPTREVFVYYRVRLEDLPAVVAAVDALHKRWREHYDGLACALLRREAEPDLGSGVVTLMEVYKAPQGVALEWQTAIEASASAALAPWRVGSRHVEVFVPCA
jgi:hypothetical protein